MTTANTWYKAWLGSSQFDTVESRPNLRFGRTLRLSSDRHDSILPQLATKLKIRYGQKFYLQPNSYLLL